MNNENQKPKKDKKSLLLVLLFVFLFCFVMGMPNINKFLDNLKKEAGMDQIEKQARDIEKRQNESNSNKPKQNADGKIVSEALNKLVCTSTTVALENYDKTVVETFEYNSKKQVLKSTVQTTYKFNQVDDFYEELKTKCNESGLKYADKKGYTPGCSYKENEVVIEDSFDLETFKTITDGATEIKANAKYQELIDGIDKKLTANGYICK